MKMKNDDDSKSEAIFDRLPEQLEELGNFPKNPEAHLSGPVVTFDQLPEEIQRHYPNRTIVKTLVNIWLTKTHAGLEFPPEENCSWVDFWKKAPDGNWVLQYSGLVMMRG